MLHYDLKKWLSPLVITFCVTIAIPFFFSENLTFDQKVAILGLLFQLIKSYCEGIFEHDKNLSTSTRDIVLIWVIVDSVGIRGTGYCDEVPLSRHAIVLL